MVISSSGCGYGKGRTSAASMTLKSAVEMPVPSASVNAARIENEGCRRSWRSAYFTSWSIVSITPPPRTS